MALALFLFEQQQQQQQLQQQQGHAEVSRGHAHRKVVARPSSALIRLPSRSVSIADWPPSRRPLDWATPAPSIAKG